MTIDDIAYEKERVTKPHVLAKAALRYEAVRSLTPKQFAALW